MADTHDLPPMDPSSSEADEAQLDLARAQGEAYGRALEHMATKVAEDGGQQRAGDYLIAYAVEEAEGMYEWADGELRWVDPGEDNLHVEISVRDAADGRFVPAARVTASLVGPDGELGPEEHPLLWHPMLYHYGRNWKVEPGTDYTLRVHVDPPRFMRHDEINGRRFTEPAEVAFEGIRAPEED